MTKLCSLQLLLYCFPFFAPVLAIPILKQQLKEENGKTSDEKGKNSRVGKILNVNPDIFKMVDGHQKEDAL